MKTLNRTASRFEEWFTTDTGLRIRGRRVTASDGAAVTSSYSEPRHVLHVRRNEDVVVGQHITDAVGNVFLLALHDEHIGIRKTFRLFRMTEQVNWKRATTTTDTVTQETRTSGLNTQPAIWIASELYGREEVDRGLHISADRVRIITGANIQLNDVVNDKRVVRLTKVFGVNIAEIQ